MTDQTDAQQIGRPDHQLPKKIGRPTTFNQEIADKICDHIANGGYATKLERFGLPSSSTLGQWLNNNEAFAAAYARARERRAEHFADEMVEIADTAEDPAKARLQVETRKWVASKLFPRMYGENQRVEVQHTISDTAARVLSELSQRQRERKAEQAKVIDVTPLQGTVSVTQVVDTDAVSYQPSSDIPTYIPTGDACLDAAPSLDEGVPHQQDQQLTIECTASAPRRRAGRGEPPAPGSIVDPPLPETPPRSTRRPRKK